jgi:hypothetical protein
MAFTNPLCSSHEPLCFHHSPISSLSIEVYYNWVWMASGQDKSSFSPLWPDAAQVKSTASPMSIFLDWPNQIRIFSFLTWFTSCRYKECLSGLCSTRTCRLHNFIFLLEHLLLSVSVKYSADSRPSYTMDGIDFVLRGTHYKSDDDKEEALLSWWKESAVGKLPGMKNVYWEPTNRISIA